MTTMPAKDRIAASPVVRQRDMMEQNVPSGSEKPNV